NQAEKTVRVGSVSGFSPHRVGEFATAESAFRPYIVGAYPLHRGACSGTRRGLARASPAGYNARDPQFLNLLRVQPSCGGTISGHRAFNVMTSPVDHSRGLGEEQPRSGPTSRRALRRGGIAAILRSPALVSLGVLAIAVLFAACGGVERFPQTALDPRSDVGIEVDNLQMLTIYLASGVGAAVLLILGYILVHFRYKPGAPEPRQVHGNTQLELAWTLIPAVLISIIAIPTVRTIFSTQADAPPGALEVDVYGFQWWWEFRYPLANGDTVITANEVHVEVGRPVELRMPSSDVIHSFWIPQMG